jgi:hypothetical protein
LHFKGDFIDSITEQLACLIQSQKDSFVISSRQLGLLATYAFDSLNEGDEHLLA